jgi:DNA (cytosine-5)-methyltransferase 1
MAEILAREIAKQFFGWTYEKPPTLRVPRCENIPDPEPVKTVPEKYLHLVGRHTPHPGTGKGKKYRQQKKIS